MRTAERLRHGASVDRLMRYGAVGLLSTGVYFAVFVGSIELAGTPIWLSACAAFVSGTAFSYLGNALWTFGQRVNRASAGRYMTVVVSSFTVNLFIAALLDAFGVHYLIIFCVEAVTLTAMNFAGHLLWTFAPSRNGPY